MTAKRAHKEMQVKRFLLKGHLRYKTIISENVSSETQVENFFCFRRKLCYVLETLKFLYSQPSNVLPNL